jgi:hypothetical protein
MRLAIYHGATLELLGTLDGRMPERQFGQMKDGRKFELPMQLLGQARYDPNVGEVEALHLIKFEPLSLNRDGKRTFILFVDCHPDDLKRVVGYKPI